MKSNYLRKVAGRRVGLLLAAALAFGSVFAPAAMRGPASTAYAAEATIYSMDYYSPTDGPVLSSSGVGEASYGFVMPIFNGGSASWEDVASDLSVSVLTGGSYVDIDNISSFSYNSNWGHWQDGGFTGYWFKVSRTTQLRLYSKSSGVYLDYTLEFTNINTTTISSMAATQGPELTAGPTGSVGFTWPVFNGDSAIPYDAVADDLKVYVKSVSSSDWVGIDNNAASGWIYDQNWGHFTDGPGGLWFTLTESINVKLESVSSGASIVYTLNYQTVNRNSYTLSAYDGTTDYAAGEDGALGIALPKIDGTPAQQADLDKFVYELKVGGNWVELGDYSKSTFVYAANGYNKMSEKNQWGYWVDYIYGLWFQPLTEDYDLRIGFPENGEKGGAVNNNYVYYHFTGNPDAPRPTPPDDDFIPGDPDNTALAGWDLVFDDEFSGSSLDTSTWNYVTGYYINDDPGTWGWGNKELEHYTDSDRNVYVKDGALNITAYEEPKSFPQDPSRVAQYSSGKITTENKFSFKYGRIDFRAKLPTGNGLWPALWLLPDDDTYGTWAASGEIDVMEARGRIPEASSGALHFGGTWPANKNLSEPYTFPAGESIDSAFHTYSVVWEENMIKWYVDGNLFFYLNSDQWYTTASSSKTAPFDKEFYIIMNLAVGGWFDNEIAPGPGDIPATMQVDYVRVYKAQGDDKHTSTGSHGAGGDTGSQPGGGSHDETGNTPGDGGDNGGSGDNGNHDGETGAGPVQDHVGDAVCGLDRNGSDVTFYVKGAEFADLHFKVNNGGQMNVGMKSDGNRNYTYTVSDLKDGDRLDYFFTYNPGNGALDTAWASYELTAAAAGGSGDDKGTEPVKDEDKNDNNNGSGDNGSGDNGTITAGDGVTLYLDSDYRGKAVTFDVGRYNMSDMIAAGIPNDSVSSIKVPLGYKLTAYWDINYGGESKVFTADSNYVGNHWNDQITSFIIEEESYYIYNKHSNLVLDVSGFNTDNGANLCQYSLTGADNQKWTVSKADNGSVKLTSVLSGKVIDVENVSSDNGANVHLWEYVGGDNQKWNLTPVEDGYYYITSVLSSKSLDADAWSQSPGSNIIQWALGDKQANQMWKFVPVDTDPADPTAGSGNNNSGNGNNGSSGGNDYADKPVLRTDIAKRDGQMFFQFNNKTGGEYRDDQIYWTILGFDPQSGKLSYVDKNGNLIPASASMNTITRGDRKCSDVFYTLAEKNYVYMPDITSGRMYISYGSPVYITINEDANGNVGFAGPDLNNPTDPNQDVLFEFVEFTISGGEYWGNTTRVDFYSFPVVSRLVGEGGYISTPGDADRYDKTVGDIGSRSEIFSAFTAEVPSEFKTLVDGNKRIMAPCKKTFNEGQPYAHYFDAYIDQIWDKYRNQDLVFTCEAGTFRGRTYGDQMIFSKDNGESGIVVHKPTTQDALEGKGTLAQGTSLEKVVEAQLCAAINRGVALTPEKWADSSAFYKNTPANFYSGFFHNHSVDNLAYGFCYDDVFDYSTLLHYTKPTALVIDLKW
ncbi:beta-1,3-glucanase family protein [Butyrivibrio sp. MC2013]|uniref:beta-1,3-glucanase family protein n=1 Tax=Butyrivibrio sp. MC2013 TaxID=1280686 RepID=UPI0003FA0678|nr:beta-1,3-glucanase family protein [Butyrivibrio sp. MC2013]